MSDRVRLDVLLARRGLARSRTAARELVEAGRVRVGGQVERRASRAVDPATELEVDGDVWVSRAAHKLLGALDAFALTPRGRALDAGASTGGFTQVLLARGCDEVVAVDVGHDQLAASVRGDPRVVVRERLNLRDLTLADVGGAPVDLVVADVSFISLRLLLAPLLAVLDPAGWALLMVKPQFEVGRERLGSGGVVSDEDLQRDAVAGVVAVAAARGWACEGVVPAPLRGQDGNQEWFCLLRRAQ